ncbi:ABC transporter permease [Bradyrhizobium sp. WSM1417]|uniref:ABC transporter permease n=1 Tax=Bradyrhizobium sp. WSM1417 TaxID=754500 RepID=UPI0004B53C17|nr:ABC transporter permease [Bradyrhizobium sp. WSM1417]
MIEILKKAAPIALFCAVWEAACFLLKIPAYIVPAPHRVVDKIVNSGALLYSHSLISIAEILIGFGLASICAVLCAIAMVHSRRVEAVLEPFLVVSQVIPKVALAPLFIIWFGHGILPKIIIAMLIAFFPVLVNAVVGLRSVDGEIIELMDSIAANRRQLFWRVRLPTSLPYIFPALKVAALLSVVGAMVGEFVGSDHGLGYLMVLGDVNLDTDLLFASLAVVTAFGMVIYSTIEIFERRIEQRYGKGGVQQQLVTV